MADPILAVNLSPFNWAMSALGQPIQENSGISWGMILLSLIFIWIVASLAEGGHRK